MFRRQVVSPARPRAAVVSQKTVFRAPYQIRRAKRYVAQSVTATVVTDADTIYLYLQPSGSESHERVDAATVYLDLQASGVSDGVANDKFTNAIDVLVGTNKETHAGTIIDATIETGFEDPAFLSTSQAVWYHFAPTVDCRLSWRVTKTGGTAGFVPEADLWHATTYPVVDGNDLAFLDSCGDGTATPEYAHEWVLLAGEHYYIAVEDYNFDIAEEGDFDLDVQAVPSYLFENWENGTIDPLVWELRRQGLAPIDPNAGVWSLDPSEAGLDDQSVVATPGTINEQLVYYDTVEGGQVDRDYWIAFKFKFSWAQIWASGSQFAYLPGITNGNNTFPHGGTGLLADLGYSFLFADSASTGFFEDFDGNDTVISDVGWHELRTRYRKHSVGGGLFMTQILDGVTILNDVNVSSITSVTGVAWRSYGFGGIVHIDPLIWSPDVDPGAIYADFEDDDEVYLELFGDNPPVYEDASAVYLDLKVTSADVAGDVEAATVYLNLQVQGGECYSTAVLQSEGEAYKRWTADVNYRWFVEAHPRFAMSASRTGEHC